MSACIWVIRVLVELYGERTVQIRHPALKQARQARYWLWTGILVAVVCMLLVQTAWAANFHMFEGLERDADTKGTLWFGRMKDLVKHTFILLGTIEILWAALIWALEKDNLSGLAAEMMKKFATIGFFGVLFSKAPEWIPMIVSSFGSAGQRVAGVGPLSTDAIINAGLDLIVKLWENAISNAILNFFIPFSGLFDSIAKIAATSLTSLIVAIAFAVTAAQYFALRVEAAVLLAAGAIFLAFGSSSWTRDYVHKYLNYTISVGLRLLVLTLILSITLDAVCNMRQTFAWDWAPLFGVLAAAVLQAILAIKVPEMASALLQGGAALTAGSMSGAAGSTMGAAVATASIAGNVMKAANHLSKAAGAANQARGGGASLPRGGGGPMMNNRGAQSGPTANIGGLSSTAASPADARGASGNAAGNSGGQSMGQRLPGANAGSSGNGGSDRNSSDIPSNTRAPESSSSVAQSSQSNRSTESPSDNSNVFGPSGMPSSGENPASSSEAVASMGETAMSSPEITMSSSDPENPGPSGSPALAGLGSTPSSRRSSMSGLPPPYMRRGSSSSSARPRSLDSRAPSSSKALDSTKES